METLKLTVNEKDTLDSILYYASKSEQIKKARRNSRLIFIGIIILLSILFLAFDKSISIAFIVVGVIGYIFFPQYLKWYYKKHFSKTIQAHEYRSLVGLENSIIFNEDNIEVKNSKAETKYLHQNFDYISETHDNFFIKLKTISILTFPKNQIKNSNALRDYFQKLCAQIKIEYIDDKNWTWK